MGVNDTGDHDLRHLSLLLEATTLLQSRMPYLEVLGAMVDRAIMITEADRGLLLASDADGQPGTRRSSEPGWIQSARQISVPE